MFQGKFSLVKDKMEWMEEIKDTTAVEANWHVHMTDMQLKTSLNPVDLPTMQERGTSSSLDVTWGGRPEERISEGRRYTLFELRLETEKASTSHYVVHSECSDHLVESVSSMNTRSLTDTLRHCTLE